MGVLHSQTYKCLPSAGSITYYDPETGAKHEMKLPEGGRGYLRPPSLLGLWYSAPYLNNNSLGSFRSPIRAGGPAGGVPKRHGAAALAG